MNLTYLVNNNDNFDNLKELLKLKFQISDRLLTKLKKHNRLFINNEKASIYAVPKLNDYIDINIDFDEDDSSFPATQMNLDIIYEDEAYLIVNKPSGIPVHPSLNHYEDSLANGIKYYFNSIGLKRKIRPVNRLDKNTSGLVVFAKNEYIQECLTRQMKNNTFIKEYVAICSGNFKNKEGKIDAPIARKENSIIERCISETGAPSTTYYTVLEENLDKQEPYSVVKCKLETGRTHQIRVHLTYIGHPLLGDTLYGKYSMLINRQALHSIMISFIHPLTYKQVSYTADLPKDMVNLVNNIDKLWVLC